MPEKRKPYAPKRPPASRIAWTGKGDAPRYLSIGALTLTTDHLPPDKEQREGFATTFAGAILDSVPGYKRVVESRERAAEAERPAKKGGK